MADFLYVQSDISHDMQYMVFNRSELEWSPGIVARQWLWVVIGPRLILLSAVWFARFDPSWEGLRRVRTT